MTRLRLRGVPLAHTPSERGREERRREHTYAWVCSFTITEPAEQRARDHPGRSAHLPVLRRQRMEVPRESLVRFQVAATPALQGEPRIPPLDFARGWPEQRRRPF